MEEKELIVAIGKLLNPYFEVRSINHANYKPHPFVIGPRLIVWVSDNWSGMLSEDAIRDYEKKKGSSCSIRGGCNVPYDEHTSDKVLFLSLSKNLSHAIASKRLKSITDLMTEHKIDGISFVETDQRYRIGEPK